jgi:hypothetical protein
MKRTIAITIAGIALACFGSAQGLIEPKLTYAPTLHSDFGLATRWQNQNHPNLASWDRLRFSYDPYEPRWAKYEFGFTSRFDLKKLSFREIFGRDSGFEFRSSDYIPGVRGTRISRTGGEIWIRL